jgi:hypothetical protein
MPVFITQSTNRSVVLSWASWTTILRLLSSGEFPPAAGSSYRLHPVKALDVHATAVDAPQGGVVTPSRMGGRPHARTGFWHDLPSKEGLWTGIVLDSAMAAAIAELIATAIKHPVAGTEDLAERVKGMRGLSELIALLKSGEDVEVT